MFKSNESYFMFLRELWQIGDDVSLHGGGFHSTSFLQILLDMCYKLSSNSLNKICQITCYVNLKNASSRYLRMQSSCLVQVGRHQTACM
jgi:hypothetical protein